MLFIPPLCIYTAGLYFSPGGHQSVAQLEERRSHDSRRRRSESSRSDSTSYIFVTPIFFCRMPPQMRGIFAWKGRKKMNYRSTRNYENMERRIYDGVGKYGIAEIQPAQFDMPKEFVAFSAAAQCQHREDRGVHFFIDDYRFNRLWTAPDRYLDMLRQFQCVMTPDFSLYTDFPKAVQIYNHYRKH